MKENHKMIFRKRFSLSNGRVFFSKKKELKRTQKLTLLKHQEKEMKGRSFQEENCMILSDCKGQGQNIFKRENMRKNIFKKWREMVKKREWIFFQKRCLKRK